MTPRGSRAVPVPREFEFSSYDTWISFGARVDHATGSAKFAFKGLIADVVLYRRALDAKEVQSLFKLGPGGAGR